MSRVTRERVVLKNYKTNAVSEFLRTETTNTHVVVQLTGTGAVSATVNVYGGVFNQTTGDWEIKQLDANLAVTGVDSTSGRVVLNTLTRFIQIEVVGLTGTNATISVGLIHVS